MGLDYLNGVYDEKEQGADYTVDIDDGKKKEVAFAFRELAAGL